MSPDSFFHYVGQALDTFLVDLLLSGDNAIVIAMACRSLPAPQQQRAILIGTGGAVALRVLLTALAGLLLGIPGVKLIGGCALVAIAIKLLVAAADPADGASALESSDRQADGLAAAVGVIVVADLAMSIDNVVALAAVAQGDVAVLVVGLLFSVPLLMYGTRVVMGLLERYPLLVPAGGAMLGWLAGNIAVADPLLSEWIATQAPLLAGLIPVLLAGFVLAESRIILSNRPRLLALRPKRTRVVRAPRPMPVRKPGTQFAQRATAAPDSSLRRDDDRPTPAAELRNTHGGGRRKPMRARRTIGIAAAWTAVAAVLAFAVFRFVASEGPDELRRYDCAAPDGVAAYYRRSAGHLVLNSRTGSAVGVVSDGNIDWRDNNAARAKLGFSPPTALSVAGPDAIRLKGGAFPETDCAVR